MIRVQPDFFEMDLAEGDLTARVELRELVEKNDTHGLLLWGIFYQLVGLRHANGTFDVEKGTGEGLMGLIAQITRSSIETSERVGRLAEAMEDLAKQAKAGQAFDAGSVMAQAKDMMGDLMSGMQRPDAAKVTRSDIGTAAAAAAAAESAGDQG